MKKTLFGVFALACALATVAAVSAAADSPDEIANYKNWTRLTAEPIVVESAWVGG